MRGKKEAMGATKGCKSQSKAGRNKRELWRRARNEKSKGGGRQNKCGDLERKD